MENMVACILYFGRDMNASRCGLPSEILGPWRQVRTLFDGVFQVPPGH
jgi:hypothetical protein